jgi:hypothetical protein
MEAKTLPRTPKGQFKKGTSGNLAGRPLGSRNKATLLCEQLLHGQAEQITQKLVELALKGNMQAICAALDRLVPPRKERSVNLELRPVSDLQDLALQYQEIVSAIAAGDITPAEGESLSNILTSQSQTLERVNLEQRVENLEAFGREVQSYRSEIKQQTQQLGNTVMREAMTGHPES